MLVNARNTPSNSQSQCLSLGVLKHRDSPCHKTERKLTWINQQVTSKSIFILKLERQRQKVLTTIRFDKVGAVKQI